VKIAGRTFSLPKPQVIVIPREDGDIIFYAATVIDRDEFDKICPAPKPPLIVRRDKTQYTDVTDPKYLDKIGNLSRKRFAWLIIKSLSATPDLTWEKVNINDPDTWLNYEEELKDSGFNTAEINAIVSGVMDANSMNEDKFKAAKDRFIHSQVAKPLAIFPPEEQ